MKRFFAITILQASAIASIAAQGIDASTPKEQSFVYNVVSTSTLPIQDVNPIRPTMRPEKVEPKKVKEAELRCLAMNVYFEAGNQSMRGKQAVALVTMNRVEQDNWPDNICDVVKQGPRDGSPIRKYKCQYSWYCDGKADIAPMNNNPDEIQAWNDSVEAASLVYSGNVEDFTNGANHYHADYVSPNWKYAYEKIGKVGKHVFYKAGVGE